MNLDIRHLILGGTGHPEHKWPEACLMHEVACLPVVMDQESIGQFFHTDFTYMRKRAWGTLMGSWVSPRIRDEVVDYMQHYVALTELPLTRLLRWLGVGRAKYYSWQSRYGWRSGACRSYLKC